MARAAARAALAAFVALAALAALVVPLEEGQAAARAAPPVMRERSQRIFRSSGLGCLWSFEAATGESAADVKYESPAVRDSVASWWDM